MYVTGHGQRQVHDGAYQLLLHFVSTQGAHVWLFGAAQCNPPPSHIRVSKKQPFPTEQNESV